MESPFLASHSFYFLSNWRVLPEVSGHFMAADARGLSQFKGKTGGKSMNAWENRLLALPPDLFCCRQGHLRKGLHWPEDARPHPLILLAHTPWQNLSSEESQSAEFSLGLERESGQGLPFPW